MEKKTALQAAQLNYLYQLLHSFNSSHEVDNFLKKLPEALPKEMCAAIIAVFINDPIEGIALMMQTGAEGKELDELSTFYHQEYILSEIINSKQSEVFLSKDSDILENTDLQSGIIVPLSLIDNIGVLFVGVKELEYIDSEVRQFIQAVGIQIGQALSLNTLFKKVINSEKRYRSLFENASCSIFVADLKGTILETNKQGEILLGAKREEIIGKRFKDYFISPFRERLGEWTQNLAKNKILNQTEIQVARSNGEVRTVDGSGVLVEIEKEPFVFMIGTDVTEINQFRAQSLVTDKLSTLGLLAAGVAHEINNPIACMLSNLDFLKDKIKEPDLKQPIEESIEAGNRVKEIVTELNIYTRKDELLEKIDICSVLDSALNMAFPEWKNKASIEKHFESNLPLMFINRGKIHQVFLNLIVNAANSFNTNDPTHNKIILSTKRIENKIVVEVQDNGIGIKKENIKKIFDPFFTTKAIGEGTGLGLFICHEIILSMKGCIQVESTPGIGSCFTVELPMDAREKIVCKT